MRLEMNLLSESTNNQKLMLEYEKHQELQLKLQRMQESYEGRLHNLEDGHVRALEDMTQFYEAKLQEKVLELGQVRKNSHCGALPFFMSFSSVCDLWFSTTPTLLSASIIIWLFINITGIIRVLIIHAPKNNASVFSYMVKFHTCLEIITEK